MYTPVDEQQVYLISFRSQESYFGQCHLLSLLTSLVILRKEFSQETEDWNGDITHDTVIPVLAIENCEEFKKLVRYTSQSVKRACFTYDNFSYDKCTFSKLACQLLKK